ncbi:MAG TPA: DUF885 domain-containing protein [Candidatus Acidoferrum sp.]|nr:DUF885 domain-containing protein [Candidatus Acidoferrum sp.]
MKKRGRIALGLGLLWSVCFAARLASGEVPTDWNVLVDEFLDQAFFPEHPSWATVAGLHQYDSRIENYSKAGIAGRIGKLHAFETRVAGFPTAGLGAVDAADQKILLGQIRSELLSLESIRPLEKNPDVYSGSATSSVYVLMIRKFAPPETRLQSVVAREKQIPGMLADARENLKNPPRIYTEIAIQQMPGIVSFFEKDVPLAFAGVKDEKVKAEFATSNGAVVAALREYDRWLKTDLLPRSNGDFRIGADNFAKRLRYEDMVDIPLDRLLEIGKADLQKNQSELRRVAAGVDPKKSPQEVMAELGRMHPAPDKLMDTFRGTFDSLIGFIQEKYIITIPPGPQPLLIETPPFMRATTTASMDTPGPFETKATESYFDVTLPAPGDSPEEVASLMEGFNIGTIFSTSTHETYPGHYLQYLWTPRAPSKLRKILQANTNVEGWAHYSEQMMMEQGYLKPGIGAKDEREAGFIHLGQLQDALLRDSRFVVGLEMHTGNMSFAEAKTFFVKEGFQTAKIADIEAKRGTSDATYLYYTLGKLEILKLREDYQRKMGTNFVLGKFHDEFMSQGFPPIAIVRQALLGDASGVL